jgi:hypothetical protein
MTRTTREGIETMKTEAARTFRNPTSFTEHGLRYMNLGDNGHAVLHYFPAGEQDCPNVHHHDTIEAARETWATIAGRLKVQGYKVVPNRDWHRIG